MTQESTNTPESSENRKKILLGVLFLLLIVVVYFQFINTDERRPGSSSPAPAASSTSPTLTRPVTTTRTAAPTSPIVSMPLDLMAMTSKFSGAGSGRNIFVFPTPTPAPTPKPVPPPPPPPPPPVTLNSLSPSGVIARTGDFSLVVFGQKIPADAQIYVDGRVFETKPVSDTEAQARIPGDVIRGGGNLSITVRSKSDPSLYSNQVTINVAEPPSPLYRYIGLIVTPKTKIAVVKEMDGDENVINMTENTSYKCDKNVKTRCKWKLLSINAQRLTFEDLDLRITHNITFTGEGGGGER